jgi:hypothetical protein
MKVIGIIPEKYHDNKFIFEATMTEMRNLMGYRYSQRELDERLSVGAEIPISEMYNKLFDMANQEKELMQISAKLKAAADFCDTALPTIKLINKQESEDK